MTQDGLWLRHGRCSYLARCSKVRDRVTVGSTPVDAHMPLGTFAPLAKRKACFDQFPSMVLRLDMPCRHGHLLRCKPLRCTATRLTLAMIHTTGSRISLLMQGDELSQRIHLPKQADPINLLGILCPLGMCHRAKQAGGPAGVLQRCLGKSNIGPR